MDAGQRYVFSVRGLVIRADADGRIGTGHLTRCLALAQAWRAQGGEACVVGRCDSPGLRARLLDNNIELVSLERVHPDEKDLALTLRTLESNRIRQGGRPSWLVLDGYHFDPEYHLAIRRSGHPLLVIDDTGHLAHYHASILLNQNLGADELPYHCDDDTVQLFGPRYALLRPEFQRWRDWSRTIPEVAKHLLVTMGGADPDNVTLKVIDAIRQLDQPALETRIVVGPANQHYEVLSEAAGSDAAIELLVNVDDMASHMAWADVAVSAGGSTCWEAAFMGVPCLFVIVAENQRRSVEGLAAASAAIDSAGTKT